MLQALGLTPRQTGAIVLVEGLALSAVSGLIGVGLGLTLTWRLFGDGLDVSAVMSETDGFTISGAVVDPVIVPLFGARRIAQSALFILGVGVAAAVYPAVRAARIDVTEAMKFDR